MSMLVSSILFAVAFQTSTNDSWVSDAFLSSAEWAREANKCIAMGEEKAIADLIKRAEAGEQKGHTKPNSRASLLARLLFEPKGKQPLRAPGIGGFVLPHRSMPLASWPTYPFVEQKGVVFLMSDGGIGTGLPERCRNYIAYCQKNGKFRTKPYVVPTTQQAVGALRDLYETDRWKAIEWSYSSSHESYNISQETVTELLLKQAQP